jgi:hypothetical protein
VLPAARAVAVIRPDERGSHLEADTAAEAGAAKGTVGARFGSHPGILFQPVFIPPQ